MSIKGALKYVMPASLLEFLRLPSSIDRNVADLRELIYLNQTVVLQQSHPNPLNRFGRKCFSQTDEDGVTLEILRRIGCLEGGAFAEFGVADGLENNTLVLKALGWRGFWVGGEDLAFEVKQPPEKFTYLKRWVTLDNIESLARAGMEAIGRASIDVLSLDLDGNDFYFVERLLSVGVTPKLFIVEYNGKFPPPIEWKIDYDPAHVWVGDDYFGVSLASYCALFKRFSYRLICCNSCTGANAFFVREEYMDRFSDVPSDINDLYVPPRYWLPRKFGHKSAVKTVAKLFA